MAPVGGLNGVAITGATNASPIVISTGSTAGLVNGDVVTISGVQGNTAANGTWTIAGLTGNSFQLVNSAGNGAYTANTGTWSSGVTVTPVAGSSNSFTVTFNGAKVSDEYIIPMTAFNALTGAGTSITITPTVAGSAGNVNLADNLTLTGSGVPYTATGTVTGASNPAPGNPIVITTASTVALVTGDTVTVSGVTGNVAANGTWTITVLSNNTFALNGSTASGAYVNGGTWTYSVYPLVTQEGALMSLAGANTITGNITLNGQVGLGVEQLYDSSTGTISNASNTSPITITTNSTAGLINGETVVISGVGGNTAANGTFTIANLTSNSFDLLGSTGSAPYVSGGQWTSLNYSSANNVLSQLTLLGRQSDGASSGGINKLGSQRLILQGPGTFTGPVDIQQGVILLQNNFGLGLGGSTVTTEPGTALELASTIATYNGGIQGGLEIQNEQLILNSTGNAAFADTAPLVLCTNNTATSPSGDPFIPTQVDWVGPISLNLPFTLTFQGSLAGVSQPTLIANGSGLSGTAPTVATATSTAGGVSVLSQTFGQTFNTVQTLLFGGVINGGTFTLTYNNPTTGVFAATSPIPYSSNATTLQASIQAALNAALGAGNVLVALGYGGVATATTGGAIYLQPPTGAGQAQAAILLNGILDDNNVPFTDGSPFVVTGTGQVDLTAANTYRGTTTVLPNVVLTIDNNQALGGRGIAEVETVAVNGSGSFTLSFNGSPPTTTLNTNDPNLAADMQTALNDLTTINGAADVGGSVTVAKTGTVYTVTFGGNLVGFDQPTMISSNPAVAAVAVTNDGAGGTIVDNGASLQLQNSLTVTGEPLLVQGTGVNTAPNAPQQWFNVGPAPITNGQTIGNQNTTGRITGIAIDPNNANTIYIATAGGGAWKTTNDGQTWQPIFDAIPSVQQLTLNSGVISNASNTSPITISTTSSSTGLTVGQQVTISGVLGNTSANGTFTITNITANSFDLVGTTGNGAYVPGPATWSARSPSPSTAPPRPRSRPTPLPPRCSRRSTPFRPSAAPAAG